jgi:cytochrome c oxidase subunit 1
MGAVFAIFGGWYYWIGKITGTQYSETLGKIHFWTTFIGVNVCFFPNAFLRTCRNAKTYPWLPWCIYSMKYNSFCWFYYHYGFYCFLCLCYLCNVYIKQ